MESIKEGLKTTLGAFVVGILLAFIVSFVYFNRLHNYYATRNISDIFYTEVYIPDHRRGEDPIVAYTKYISEDFVGDYSVEIRNSNDISENCSYGDKAIPYDISKNETTLRKSLSWYLGQPIPGQDPDCFKKLQPGKYALVTTYKLYQDGRSTRTISYTSNIFEIEDTLIRPLGLNNKQYLVPL